MSHPSRLIVPGLCLGVVLLSISAAPAGPFSQDRLPPRAIQPLIVEVDWACSFFLVDEPVPLRILAPVRAGEKEVLADFDEFYVQAGGTEFATDQVWQVIEYGTSLRPRDDRGPKGKVAFRRGRARWIRQEGDMALFRVEKACGPIMAGDGLVPYLEGEVLRGEILPWEGPFQGGDALTGRIIFLDNELVQISSGLWALIDIGADRGLAVGRQLAVFHQAPGNVPARAVGSVIVVDVGPNWSTIKVLGSREAIKLGDLVQAR